MAYASYSPLGKKIKAVGGKIFIGQENTDLQKTIAMTVKSNKDGEAYNFQLLFARIMEWLDKTNFETGTDYEYEIKNKDWVVGFNQNRNYVEDIKSDSMLSGGLKEQISAILSEFPQHKDELLNDLLINNGLCFDGTALFANSRPNIPETSTIDNLYTGTGTTLAQIQADLQGARAQMRSWKIKGRPVNKNPDLVIYAPSQLENQFLTILNSENINLTGTPESNVTKGYAKLIINDEQDTSNNDWYIYNAKSPMKPLILQERKNPEFNEIDNKEVKYIKYQWDSRYNAGYGNPMSIIKIDN